MRGTNNHQMDADTNREGAQTQGGQGEVLADPHRQLSDCNLIRRCARERWPIPEGKRRIVAEKMTAIIEADTTVVLGEDGPIEVSNARNQVAAARVLATFEQQNQADDHLADKNARLDEGKATENVGVGEVLLRRPINADSPTTQD